MSSPRTVLIIGIAPEAVDYSDPKLPKGLSAEVIAAGLKEAQRQFAGVGDRADLCLIQTDGTGGAAVATSLAQSRYDCIVIGGGIRDPKANLALFEQIVNIVHRHAPGATIAFNTTPEESLEAADRVLPRD